MTPSCPVPLVAALVFAGLAAAAPAAAQEGAADAARLEAMTCREFLALDAAGQATVKAALLAHAADASRPAAPPPPPAQGEAGAAPPRVVEDRTGVPEGAAPEPKAGTGDATAAGTQPAAAAAGTGTGAPEVVAGENESGKIAPDGTEASVTDEGGDRRLVAMRTSCEGGPDARAPDALRAAYGDSR